MSKHSLGQTHFNPGTRIDQTEKPFVLDNSRCYYIFDVVPVGAVRMTKRDTIFTNPNHPDPKKRQREAVARYFEFQNTVWQQYRDFKLALPDHFEIVFCVPMPSSWSDKKKTKFNRMPCKSRPDVDNYLKAFMDTIKIEDGSVWKCPVQKIYAYKGSIILFI